MKCCTDYIKNKKKIQRIEEIIEGDILYANEYFTICSLTVTEDKRIASGSYDGNISISSYDVNERKWKREIYKTKAHIGWVTSLCALNGNRLLSGSDDCSIKLWTISDVALTLIKEIKEHTDYVCKVIPLSKERYASCSNDGTVKVWKDDNTYECLSTLEHDRRVKSILQLRGKEVLVSCGYSPSTGVSFWNLNDYTKLHTIEGYGVYYPTHMIELSDGNIALSAGDEPYPIVIIDSSSYEVKKKIQLEEYITRCSSLCVCDEHSFVYAYDGTFLQISNEDGEILFKSKGGNFDGHYGILPLEGGKYFAIENGRRISIIKPCYA